MFFNIMVYQSYKVCKDDTYYNWINNGPSPKMSISLSVGLVKILPSMAKWILHI